MLEHPAVEGTKYGNTFQGTLNVGSAAVYRSLSHNM
jgi:hypothetical protein